MKNKKMIFFLALMMSVSTSIKGQETKLETGLLVSNGAKSVDLYGVIWAALDAKDSCKPSSTNTSVPASMSSWFKSVRTFSDADAARDRKFRDSIHDLRVRLEQVTGKTSKTIVVEAARLQLDSVHMNIEAINGKDGRMALRKKLLEDLKKSLEAAKNENAKMTEAYNESLINQGLNKANAVALDACKRVQNIEECSVSNGKKTCSSSGTEPAPVPGCDVAINTLKDIHDRPMTSYWRLYSEALSSEAMNNKMAELEDNMSQMNATIPKSNDAAFNWTTPMLINLQKLADTRRSTGLICAVLDDAVLKASAVTYLTKLEIYGDIKEKSSLSFVSRWKEDEKLIGQSSNRVQYFEKIQKLLEALEADDSSQLVSLQGNKGKIEPYYEKLKKEFEVAKKDLTAADCGENPYPSWEKIIVCGPTSDPRYCDRNNPIGRARIEYGECMSQARANEATKTAIRSASDYVKNHADFVEIIPGPGGMGWKAKMRSPDGKVYYLDSQYDPNKKPKNPCEPDANGSVVGPC